MSDMEMLNSYNKARRERYIAERAAEDQAAAERAARVREFIAESDPEIISDLFAVIKDAVLEREAAEVFALTKYYKGVATIVHEVEAEFCNLT